MLIECDISDSLWLDIEHWIQSIGLDEYELNNYKNIFGELEGA